MHQIDWIVLVGTILTIVLYGVWRTSGKSSAQSFLKGADQSWFTMGVSVMATQASAITFLSAPGLGYESGLRFVQFYLGMPLAIILICAVFIPIYYRLNISTAYEYLESRFDLRTRLFTAFLFLVQRGMAAGITIFAPAIVLSTILGWNLTLTNIIVGLLVIAYTVSGGTKAVSLTQKWQMGVIMLGLFFAFVLLLQKITPHFSTGEMLDYAGNFGRMQALDLSFDFNERYTLWSGLTGGFFLALSYFGTDQSQVQRYLGGKNAGQSRIGLLFNAVIKIPMQFFILFVGVLLFVFYAIEKPPLYFNKTATEQVSADIREQIDAREGDFSILFDQIKTEREAWTEARRSGDNGNTALHAKRLQELALEEDDLRADVKKLLVQDGQREAKDTNYVFLAFVLDYLPIGLIGLIIAMILSAAMSSTASELNALATTSMVDFYKRLGGRVKNERSSLRISRILTVFWGGIAILFAVLANLFDNLIEMVNLLGSLFYGTILGVFVVAFFFKKVGSQAVFIAAILAQSLILGIHFYTQISGNESLQIGYLWYNLIGCVFLVLCAFLLHFMRKK